MEFIPKKLRKHLHLPLLAVIAALSTCSAPPQKPPSSPEPETKTESKPLPPKAVIQHIEVRLRESFPFLANLLIRGELTDQCTEFEDMALEYDKQTFTLYIHLKRNKSPAACVKTAKPFEELVPLPIEGLPAGVYRVKVENASTAFELEADNVTL